MSSAGSLIGKPVPRIDGPLKTTGAAKYAADYDLAGLVYGVPVCSSISSGRIKRLDTSDADRMPGVLRVYHHGNAGRLYRPVPGDKHARVDETRPPFEDEVIYYGGQYVAVVIATTLEQAQAAAETLRVAYDGQKPNVTRDLSDGFSKLKIANERGDAEAAFSSGPVREDHTYVTPVETHNPIEMHASTAHWDGNKFTLYETTQSLINHQNAMAQILGVPPENVEIIMRFLGSGFGGKLWPWPHSALAAMASRDLNRPVKLVVSRRMMFSDVGHRPRTQQRIRLAATPEGKLLSLQHDYVNDTSMLDDIGENCGESTPYLYSTANLRIRSSMVKRNLGTPTAMRGPGAVPGLYALESAMDELAIQLRMDPVQLRLLNEPEKDESNGKPFSSRHMKECLTVGAEKFGWSQRNPKVGSMRRGGLILGWGMAACSWVAERQPCTATVELNNDGTVRVSCATQDIGTGTYTIFAQVVNDKLGVPLHKIKVVLGDSSLPPGPLSGGSFVTGSVLPAIAKACDEASKSLFTIATRTPDTPFSSENDAALRLTNGLVHKSGQSPESGVPFEQILQKARVRAAPGEGKSGGTSEDPNAKKYSLHSYGAQFVEVTWDPGIARLRVSRVVTVIDGGRIINLRPARNQVEGAVVMGIGMGLFEETHYDQRTGMPINNNFADYLVATNADTPEIDVTFLDYPDLVLNQYGARGVGEIGLAGVAPAITAAVYHATGVRVRELPVRVEDLLRAPVTSQRA